MAQAKQQYKQYLETNVNPALKEIITQLLIVKPADPPIYMIEFLLNKTGQMEEFCNTSKAELLHLRQTLASLKGVTVQETEEEEVNQSESEEEEGDEDEDEVLELPSNVAVKKGPRTSVSAEAFGTYNAPQKFKPQVYPKNQEQKTRIVDKLNKAFMFSGLDQNELAVVIDAMQERIANQGDIVIQQGDDGNELYVVDSGKLECTKLFSGEKQSRKLKEYLPGDAFGELSLLYNTPRAASITAIQKSVLWVLDRNTFNHIVKGAASQVYYIYRKKRERYEAFMSQSSLFKETDPYERSKISDAFKSVSFQANETVVREGDWGDIFYMIEEGKAFASKTLEPGKPPQKVKEYGPGDYFGELALLKGEPRAASIIASVRINIDKSKMCHIRQTQLQEIVGSFRGNFEEKL